LSSFLRQSTSAVRNLCHSRAFTSSPLSRKDLIQDLYLKELRAYKPPPPVKDAHVGVVKSYSLPPTPNSPRLPSDLAAELSAYDATEPSKAAETKSTGSAIQDVGGAEAYLGFLEQDLPKPEAHH